MRSRQRSQAVVEFGIVAITFTLIMFAIADFGLLLNNWLSVSSGVRGIARDAAVGQVQGYPPVPPGNGLDGEARALKMPGVTADPHFGGAYCCAPGSALVLSVVFYDQCTPGVGTCDRIGEGVADPLSTLDNRYGTVPYRGTCTPPGCLHPSPPKAGTCHGNPCQGDSVVVTLTAAGAQVITPLVRPFFNQPGQCPDSSSPSRCYVPLSSTVTMRFEGDIL
jgi:hypothetical protein